MSLKDQAQLVFKGGISSRDQVTELSGRGVGLDSVKYEANKINGRAWIETQEGKGCTLTLDLPYLGQNALAPETSLLTLKPGT